MSRPFFISPRELIGWIVLLDTFIALMLWWGLAESFWIAMVYSHAIGSSILLLQEIVRRQLWPDASCFPPVRSFWWMMAVLVPKPDQDRLRIYVERLAALKLKSVAGGRIPMGQLLQPALALAQQRTAAGGDAGLENRSAIVAVVPVRFTGVWSALSSTGRVLPALAFAAGRASSASCARPTARRTCFSPRLPTSCATPSRP